MLFSLKRQLFIMRPDHVSMIFNRVLTNSIFVNIEILKQVEKISDRLQHFGQKKTIKNLGKTVII